MAHVWGTSLATSAGCVVICDVFHPTNSPDYMVFYRYVGNYDANVQLETYLRFRRCRAQFPTSSRLSDAEGGGQLVGLPRPHCACYNAHIYAHCSGDIVRLCERLECPSRIQIRAIAIHFMQFY